MKVIMNFAECNDRLQRALNMELTVTKKTAREITDRAWRGVIRNVFSITPPMGGTNASIQVDAAGKKTGRTDFPGGRRAGERTIKSDIRKAFRAINDVFNTPNAEGTVFRVFGVTLAQLKSQTSNELLAWYLSKRNKRKRIVGAPRRPAFQKQIDWVEKEVLKLQGKTAAGWVPAAQRWGATVPSWITRWASTVPGTATEFENSDGIVYRATNSTTHADSRKMQRRLEQAYGMQANNIERQLERLATKKL